MRALSRFALIGLIGGASAACSTDAVRLDPFSNPFSSSASGDPGATGSLPEGGAVAPAVRSTPIQSRPLSAPLGAAPLSNRQASAPVQTPRVAAAAPVTGGPAGWSAAGGTTITVGPNDSLSQMSTRFGVPSAAILQANGLSSAAQVTAGRQIVIPVYHAGGAPAMSARAVPAAPAPRVPVAETRPAEPVRRVAEAAPRPEPVRREPARREPEPEPEAVRKVHARPGQAEAKPVAPAAAERAAKLNHRKPEPREEDEGKVAAKPQRPDPKVAAKPEKAVAKVAARRQDDDEEETVAAKPQRPEPKAVAKAPEKKPEPKKVAEAPRPEPKAVEVKKVEPKKAEAKVEVKKPEPKQAEAPKPEVKKVAEVKPAPAPKPEPVKPVKVASLPEKAPEPAPAPAVAPAAPAPDPQSSFRWPARGRVISGYGSSGNEGINIAVPEGTPVKAAEEGTVAYAGSDVKGYGKLVLVRHANGYVSAYAHNGEIDVRPGEKVKRGQTIAKSGASGNVTSPQLHFEIRKGATPVDPVPHLASN
ncbi:peptidoglycan DD-metalloendopeptidase family protein [Methylobacterium currus]|nr:peptidoglycan DD-metalloendopeptidase family protein [Methylobacterium currus]UHC14057.1 peptidoglycan DD-metalloendopeptidase family protein [Methylobacterium currus]